MSWKEDVRKLFSSDVDADKWDRRYTEEGRSFEDEIFRRRCDFTIDYVTTNYGADAKLCDLGCGAGPVIAELLKRGYNTVGLDYSEDMLINAKRRLATSNVSGRPLAVSDIQMTPLADESIDCAICLGVISYVETYGNIIKEIRRILRPGGTSVITFRNQKNLLVCDPVGPLRYLARQGLQLVNKGLKKFQIGHYMSLSEVLRVIRNGGLTFVSFKGIGFGPIRFNRSPLLSETTSINIDQTITRWMNVLGWEFPFRLAADIHILVVRKEE